MSPDHPLESRDGPARRPSFLLAEIVNDLLMPEEILAIGTVAAGKPAALACCSNKLRLFTECRPDLVMNEVLRNPALSAIGHNLREDGLQLFPPVANAPPGSFCIRISNTTDVLVLRSTNWNAADRCLERNPSVRCVVMPGGYSFRKADIEPMGRMNQPSTRESLPGFLAGPN